jgi:hypothetical protein
MNQRDIDDIFEKGQKAVERYHANKINIIFPKIQNRIHYHYKIASYLQNFDLKNKIGDSSYIVHGNFDNITLLKKFLTEKYEIAEALEKTKRECYYIIDRHASENRIILFYGNEQETFEKAVIQKNLYTKGIVHIIEGKIVGNITKKEIVEIILKFDREYGKILLKIYNSTPH